MADFGACLFVEELFAAADDDDDTENHQQEGDDQLRPSTRKTAVPGAVSVEQSITRSTRALWLQQA